MDAICKPDYDKRVKANLEAEKAKKKASEAKSKEADKIVIPEIGYHDVYGVWFYGQLKEIILKVGAERFEANLDKTMHVFVDIEPKKISEGVHDILVYGHQCRLYKWMGQGYHRGLVVLADDESANKTAERYRQSCTWSWKL